VWKSARHSRVAQRFHAGSGICQYWIFESGIIECKFSKSKFDESWFVKSSFAESRFYESKLCESCYVVLGFRK
jgi:hypothetical protein